MGFFSWILIIVICFTILCSLVTFIRGEKINVLLNMKESKFSKEIFYALLIVYTIIIIGFGLIYLTLSFQGIILVEHGEFDQANLLGSMIHSFYFSGVTLLTIGYGDIVPIGVGRLIALIQALVGYVLPTAFVLRLVQARTRGNQYSDKP